MNVPLMSLFVSPQFALAVMMPILIVMDMIIIWHYRNSWDRSIVLMLIPGAILGVIIGAMTFHYMNADIIKFIVYACNNNYGLAIDLSVCVVTLFNYIIHTLNINL